MYLKHLDNGFDQYAFPIYILCQQFINSSLVDSCKNWKGHLRKRKLNIFPSNGGYNNLQENKPVYINLSGRDKTYTIDERRIGILYKMIYFLFS